MEKIVLIGDKEMRMRATALIPRLYRHKFGRDLIADMNQLQNAFKDAGENGFDVMDLTIFENVAWLMLKQGGEEVGNDPDEWLDSIDGVFSIYQVLPSIMELWTANLHQTSSPAKK